MTVLLVCPRCHWEGEDEACPMCGVVTQLEDIFRDAAAPECRCVDECPFPCWQHHGIVKPCERCGCGS